MVSQAPRTPPRLAVARTSEAGAGFIPLPNFMSYSQEGERHGASPIHCPDRLISSSIILADLLDEAPHDLSAPPYFLLLGAAHRVIVFLLLFRTARDCSKLGNFN